MGPESEARGRTGDGASGPGGAGFPRLFVIATFVASTLVGIAVAYLGVRGTLGAGIP